MSRRPALRAATAVATLTLLAGCTDGPADDADADPGTTTSSAPPDPTSSPTGQSSTDESATTESPTGDPTSHPSDALPPVRDAVSLPALMRENLRGGRIRRERTQLTNEAYARYEVTYPSGDLRVSGILLVPAGRGPFPAVVLNHGYIEPSIYVTGQGLSREQDYLARAGFAVLHTGSVTPGTPSTRCGR